MRPAKFYTADQIFLYKQRVHLEGIDLQFYTSESRLSWLGRFGGKMTHDCPGVSVERNGDVVDVYFHRERINQDGTHYKIPCALESDGIYSIKIPFDFSTGEAAEVRLNGTFSLGRWQQPTSH